MKNLKSKKVLFSVLVFVMASILLIFSGVQIGFQIYKMKTKKSNHDYYNQKCDEFKLQNKNFKKGQIVFIGDSITDYYPLDDYYSDLELKSYNRGISGDITQGVLDRLQISLFDINPKKVVLMIGINDIDWGLSVAKVSENYYKILSKIKENLPETEVYCMSILSLEEKMNQYFNVAENIVKIKQTNHNIQNYASEFGYTYLDLFSLLIDENEYLLHEASADGIHLNVYGYSVWKDLVKPYLI